MSNLETTHVRRSTCRRKEKSNCKYLHMKLGLLANGLAALTSLYTATRRILEV